MNQFQGFLLSSIRYGDADAITYCYSLEYGFVTLFVKNIYTARNKKKAYLFPLNELEIGVKKYTEGTLLSVTKLELIQSFYVDSNLHAGNLLMFGADFLYQVLRKETPNYKIYQAIKNFTQEVHQGNPEAHLVLILEMLKLQGFSPLLSDGEFLDPEQGQFTNVPNHTLFDRENSNLWRLFLQESSSVKRLKKHSRQRFLDSLMFYYALHQVGFQVPESLKIMKEVYD